jgi:hypothetical protein
MVEPNFLPSVVYELARTARTRRLEIGLSIDAMADLAGVPLAVVDQIENAGGGDLRVLDVAAVLGVLGLGLMLPRAHPPLKRSGDSEMSPLSIAARTASTSYRHKATPEAVKVALARGSVDEAFVVHVATLLDEAPVSLLAEAVEQVHAEDGISRELIWGNMRQIARQLRVRRPLWVASNAVGGDKGNSAL